MVKRMHEYDSPCWTCDWYKHGYHADPHTNCKDTCRKHKDWVEMMNAAGHEVIE